MSKDNSYLNAQLEAMTSLWLDHIYWTRMFILQTKYNSPFLASTAKRLHRNQDDLGANLAVFYGKCEGDKYALLLHTHIDIAAKIVGLAIEGRDTAAAYAEWVINAKQIAQFLSLRSKYIEYKKIKHHMIEHLDITLKEATEIITVQQDASVATFDLVRAQAIDMAHYIERGIRNGLKIKYPVLKSKHHHHK
jgi:hypothetical protein